MERSEIRGKWPPRESLPDCASLHPGYGPSLIKDLVMQQFDRAAEDLGNSIHFEHVNVTIPDQRLATLVVFFVAGLALLMQVKEDS